MTQASPNGFGPGKKSRVPLAAMRRLRGCPSIGFMVGSVPQKLLGNPCSNSCTESILAICSAVSLISSERILSCRCCGWGRGDGVSGGRGI